ncbi:MAG: TonB-dependent receptor, partial [Acidobacteriota bacterium]|nr:TonB-dependent receptor [Acidobacteriota bacterium]
MSTFTRFGRSALRSANATLALFLLVAAGMAQENSGKILGTVTDSTGGVIPNAKITAVGSTTPRGIETTSDANGNYQFPNLPIGVYTVTVAAAGFQSVKQADVRVQLGSEISFNPKLAVGQVSETVEVSAQAVSLDTTSSRTATNITQSQFENYAHGRNFNSILALAPGVRQEVKSGNAGVGGISVDGASGSENSYVLDGVDVSDVRRGSLRSFNAIPFEFVQEIQVKSGGFEAEYGGATGGVVNVATRSGTNDFHGQLDFALTNNQLNAGDRGYWQRSPLNADAADFFRPKEDKYRVFYPGATVGGPILKNRLFFLGSYHPELQRTERSANFTGAGPRTYTQEIINHYALARVDYNPVSKLQLNTSYIWSPQRVQGYLPNRDTRVPPPSNDLSIQGGYTPSQAYTASATYTATSRLVFTGRYGYKYLNDKGGLTGGNYGISGLPYITYLTASSAVKGPVVPADVAG